MADELDGPWKEAFTYFLWQGLELLFPEASADLDPERGFEDRSTELRRLVGESETGEMRADLLFKVWDKAGRWHPLHIEVQGQFETGFTSRVDRYATRIRDKYDREVPSLIVFADADPEWEPNEHRAMVLRLERVSPFATSKILKWAKRKAELEADIARNPFAVVVLAQFAQLDTKLDGTRRLAAKQALVFGLYDKGFKPALVRQLYKIVDWFLKLPLEYEKRFREALWSFEEERKVKHITSIERLAHKEGEARGEAKGEARGRRRLLAELISKKFPKQRRVLIEERLAEIEDAAFLETLALRILDLVSWKEFWAPLAPESPVAPVLKRSRSRTS